VAKFGMVGIILPLGILLPKFKILGFWRGINPNKLPKLTPSLTIIHPIIW